MPPNREPHRVVRDGQPDFAAFMENSISPELLETVRQLHAVKEEEDQLLSIIGAYRSVKSESRQPGEKTLFQ